jgi:hypothetical protein
MPGPYKLLKGGETPPLELYETRGASVWMQRFVLSGTIRNWRAKAGGRAWRGERGWQRSQMRWRCNKHRHLRGVSL